MKRLSLIILLLIIFSAAAWAQEPAEIIHYEPQFMPWSPEVAAQGNSFTANAKGYNALFWNPAAFAHTRSSLTLASVLPTLYFFPDETTMDDVNLLMSDPTNAISVLEPILTGNGIGLAASTGLGFVGRSLGLGLVGIVDVFAYGPNLLGVQVDANATIGFIGGLGLPIQVGPILLKAGASLRPMYRIAAYDIGVADAMAIISGGETTGPSLPDALHGTALGIDLGVLAELGDLTVGMTFRDFGGTEFNYSVSSLDEIVDGLAAGGLPPEGTPLPENERYIIPMSVNTGVSFHPDLGGLRFLFDPTIHAEYDILLVPPEEAPSLWMGLHAGVEVKVLSILELRAGINQGYITAGVGINIPLLDVNVAYFTREMGSFVGARPNQALSVEAAIRF